MYALNLLRKFSTRIDLSGRQNVEVDGLYKMKNINGREMS